MADFGLSDSGFLAKRLEDILTEQRNTAVTIFQDLVGVDDIVDTSDSSTLGRLINLFSDSNFQLWEVAQSIYSAFDPNTATGIALDNLVQYGGIARFGETYSTVTCLLSGDNGTTIPQGSVIGSEVHQNQFTTTSEITLNETSSSGIVVSVLVLDNSTDYTIDYTVGVSTNSVTYTSDSDATEQEIYTGLLTVINSSHPLLSGSIGTDGLVILKADPFQKSDFSIPTSNLSIDKTYKLVSTIATETGALSAQAGSLTVIKTPVLGWDDVTNTIGATLGSELETDEELRLRFRNTKFERSTNIIDSLYSALSNLESVDSVSVYENDTDVVDVNGLPPHSFTVVILGSDSQTIADTIWQNHPAGITSNGNTEVEVLDIQGFPHTMRFTTPTPIVIYIDMEIEVDSSFPANGADQIKSAIIDYAKSEFPVGSNVVYSRLYTPINSIDGHQVNSLTIGTSPSPVGTSNIAISFDEIASFSSVNINITEV